MKASELRIGNVIKFYNYTQNKEEYVTVTPRYFSPSMLSEDFEFSNYYRPIPITEQLLINLLFENSEFRLTDNTTLYVCVRTEGNYGNEGLAIIMQNNCPVFSFPCEYLHQLQNIFSVIGKKLKYNCLVPMAKAD